MPPPQQFVPEPADQPPKGYPNVLRPYYRFMLPHERIEYAKVFTSRKTPNNMVRRTQILEMLDGRSERLHDRSGDSGDEYLLRK